MVENWSGVVWTPWSSVFLYGRGLVAWCVVPQLESKIPHLEGEWVQALGAVLFEIVRVDKRLLWLVDGFQGNY